MAITVDGILRDSSNNPITGGSSKTMTVYLDGVSQESVETNTGDGTYSFASFAASAGQSVFVVIEGETEKGSVHTVTDGTTNLAAFDVRDTRLRIQNDNSGGSTTNPDLDDRDKDDDATNLFFTSNGGNVVMDAGNVLEIVSGNTFAPGGNVTCLAGTGTQCLITGTWTAANGETLDVRGDFNCSGTYTRATTDKLILRDKTASPDTMAITWGGNTFTDLEINSGQSADEFALSGTGTIAGQFTGTKGTLSGAASTLNLQGDIEIKTNLSPKDGDIPKFVINGTGAQTLNGTTNSGSELPDVDINKPSGTLTLTGTIGLGGDWVHINGTVDPGTSTFIPNAIGSSGTIQVTMNGTAFNNLTMNTSQGADVFQLQDDMQLNGNVNWINGTLDLQNNALKVRGNWDDDGGGTNLVVGGASTLEFNGTGAQSVNLTGDTFDTILVSNTGGIVTFDTNGWTCATYQVVAGASVTYEDSTTFLATSVFTFSGASGNVITFRSTTPSTPYTLRLQTGGTDTVTFVDVADATSSGGEEIVNTDGTDSGGNTNWVFPVSGPETQNIEARAGSFVCVVTPLFDAADAPSESTIFDVSDSTMANRLMLTIDSSGFFHWVVRSGSVDQADLTGTTTVSRGVKFVVIVVWENGDFRLYVGGLLEGSDNSGSVPTSLTGTVHIGDSVSSTLQANSNIKHAYVIDHALHEEAVQRWNSFLEKQP